MALASRAFNRVETRFVAYIIIAVLFLFYVLVLTGCLSTSPGVPDLFVVKLQAKQVKDVEVRVGYYGMCITKAGGGLSCLATYTRSPDTLNDLFLSNLTNTPNDGVVKGLLVQANIIQNKIFYALLAASGVLFLLSVVSMLLVKRYMKSPKPNAVPQQKRFRSIMHFFRQYAFGLAIAAAFSTTQATGALDFATISMPDSDSNILISGGKAVQGLQWAIVALLCLVHLATSSMFNAGSGGPSGDMGGFPPSLPPGGGMMPPPPRL
ncbi:Ca2+ regulator and membrane fusion protein Fig1-domain-containing protein [Hypoxylon trugodes]|uniref:Ca2+ regulator and membrane fusion protein Fig1-domain-containing protein n=1 Tax=Hypoxylon trugodes TaxID=326681 RepID=UPI00219B9112|nr:Ca2+ regulator and membrane fusion protein Fig1-domain-containing protein [Hypoxylon trugodes]KAI1384790.1 Ca2+ regulator and membrane fusion protein Fig1-domain-containing protein [Hypoxylon trugodes]